MKNLIATITLCLILVVTLSVPGNQESLVYSQSTGNHPIYIAFLDDEIENFNF